ncbi:MAG: class I SAM-dependent methyltransferase [Candidatus Delongbacteria bacterium]|nr:class I SAM-dependent methyltransferase [Candidatus Delongbacteria bacterium]
MEFTKIEKYLLANVFMLPKSGEKITVEILEKIKVLNPVENSDWQSAIKNLSEKGLLLEEDGIYSISEEANTMAVKIIKEHREKRFSEILVKFERSEVYGSFCERLYGRNLSQLNMTPMDQLDKLLELLNLDKNSHVLDLACGVGKITEYISDTTNAKVTGVDFAVQAIQLAQVRNKDKIDRINFVVGDMNNLQFEENSFDAIIAIDTVDFAEDLEEMIGKLKEITKNGGQMGIFYSEKSQSEEYIENLKSDNTKLAKVLKKHNLEYQVYNYTEEEKSFHKKSLQLAEGMKDEFENAGDTGTYESRVSESKHALTSINDGRISRHLYIVKVEK